LLLNICLTLYLILQQLTTMSIAITLQMLIIIADIVNVSNTKGIFFTPLL